MTISVLKLKDFKLLVEYENENYQHLSKWQPIREPDYFSIEQTKKRVRESIDNFHSGASITLVGFNHDKSTIICTCTFSNIVYGVFQACNLGYSVDNKEQGKGYMFEMLQASLNFLFTEFKLHRVMANYMPENKRSEQLLTRLGFQKEGLAKSYLKIAGSWQDHVLTSKINPSSIVSL
ncbi:MAG: GNAT family N-acetyltransferase [Colwellia sp.]|nr:GNAT family N-acetyltransferase [Colwellia sp.]